MPSGEIISDEKLQLYIEELRVLGVRASACKQAGIPYNSIRNRRLADPEFAKAEEEALEEAADYLEEEARRRAMDGTARTKIIGTGENAEKIVETVYSDTLMLALLKANKPDKFAERQKSELSGPGGKPIDMSDTTAAARIAALFDAAKRRKSEPDPDPFS